jgi:hypothetical protein
MGKNGNDKEETTEERLRREAEEAVIDKDTDWDKDD